MWATVNRVSRSSKVIGPDERLTPIEALKAITLWSAYQHFEEKSKGSGERKFALETFQPSFFPHRL